MAEGSGGAMDSFAREVASAYVDGCPDTFAGMWVEQVDARPVLTVAFTGDLERHRGALPDSVVVVGRPNSISELSALFEQVAAFIESRDQLVVYGEIDEQASRVRIEVVGDARDAQTRELVAARWGSRVQLNLVAAVQSTPEPLYACSPGDTQWALRIWWSGGPHELADVSVSEHPDRVEVTIMRNKGAVPTAAPSHLHQVDLLLEEPLASRRILDTLTGRTLKPRRDGHPPGQGHG